MKGIKKEEREEKRKIMQINRSRTKKNGKESK